MEVSRSVAEIASDFCVSSPAEFQRELRAAAVVVVVRGRPLRDSYLGVSVAGRWAASLFLATAVYGTLCARPLEPGLATVLPLVSSAASGLRARALLSQLAVALSQASAASSAL